MSQRGIIAAEGPQTCEECGRLAETRPYGFDGKEVCHDCATATPEAKAEARRRMDAYLFGLPLKEDQ